MKKITVFTPTYNRAYILEKLYRSLQSQTFTDFEWLVVDDGSTDNTSELFQQWCGEGNSFPIRYFYKENGGKCRAINFALDLAEGELFFTVDSDDYLTTDALEKLARWESSIAGKPGYCGVCGNRGTSPFETPNTLFSGEFRDGTALDRYPGHSDLMIDGERAEAFYTEIHRHFKYPEFEGERFLTEAVTSNRMAHAGYKIRYYNDIIWIWEYLPDGLTRSGFKLFLDNPRGYATFLLEKARFFPVSRLGMLKCYYGLYCDLHPVYSNSEIASILGLHLWKIRFFQCVYGMLRKWKGCRG